MEKKEFASKANFSKEFSSDLLELSDGRLHTEDGSTFQIHKIELVKDSEYFYRLFCGAVGKGRKDYTIPGISGKVLGSILSFMYSGKVTITESNVCDLLIAADYLLIDDLIMDIKNIYIRKDLAVANCLPLFLTALKIGRRDILQESFRYILTHFESVVADESFSLAELSQEVLEQFLSHRNLCVRDETPVWAVIREWVEADLPTRQCLVPGLLKYLAISDIHEQLADQILANPIVASNNFCEEIFFIKDCNQFQTNLDVLRSYILMLQSAGSVSLYSRLPSHLYFIAHYCVHNQTDGVHIYVTYDERIDLWRKIVEIDECPEFIFSVGQDIYLFATSENKNMRYSLVDGGWNSLPRLRVQRNYYSVVHLGGLVYVMGGVFSNTEEEVNDVEVYSRLDDDWHAVPPMMPITSFCAVTIGRRIYVVGNTPQFFTLDMVAQAYTVEENAWTYLQPPSVFRFNFALVGYRGQLYILGGRNEDDYLKTVEVFDPYKQEWSFHKQLPYSYFLPKAIVLNDKLIVYDNHLEDRSYLKTNPAVEWDEDKKYWRPIEKSSAINAIHKYCFFTPDNDECKNRISRENKDPQNAFSKSTFA